jgi:hypothetical protein
VTVLWIFSTGPDRLWNRTWADFGGAPFHRRVYLRGLLPYPANTLEHRTSTLVTTYRRGLNAVCQGKSTGNGVQICLTTADHLVTRHKRPRIDRILCCAGRAVQWAEGALARRRLYGRTCVSDLLRAIRRRGVSLKTKERRDVLGSDTRPLRDQNRGDLLFLLSRFQKVAQMTKGWYDFNDLISKGMFSIRNIPLFQHSISPTCKESLVVKNIQQFNGL